MGGEPILCALPHHLPLWLFKTRVGMSTGAAISAATGAQGKIQEFLEGRIGLFLYLFELPEPEHNSQEMLDWGCAASCWCASELLAGPWRFQNKAVGLSAFPWLSETPSLVPRDPFTQLSDKRTF